MNAPLRRPVPTRAEATAKLIKGEMLCGFDPCRRAVRIADGRSFCSTQCAEADASRDDEEEYDPMNDELIGAPGTPHSTLTGLRRSVVEAGLRRRLVPLKSAAAVAAADEQAKKDGSPF